MLIPLGSLDPVQAAPLTDAALTPYHAIKPSLPALVPGSTAVVIGAGGLGQMGIQLLRALTPARVVAVDKDAGRLARAHEIGAHEAVEAGDVDGVRRASGGGGADLVLDMVGSEATLTSAARMLRTEGRLVVIGLGLGTLPVNFFSIPYGAEVATSYWGTAPELIELVELARSGRVRMEVETFPLERAAEAYERLRRGEIAGRAVIVP
jgi:propanol-preferring alcohol dehydrogenase